ncbi:PDZ and LIM domain protein Zasp isoform X10 [Drosophila sechellia]|uniref:PDZ and LIM domain protein Zasp isoform X10 n=1 Tax=Drosophila sechellia TaxID=7238 RepID=UPI0013DDF888|nr:PDZ and LIM domain protein Zasp isoform X10 [Drosophila sechellia]
MAQPQLLQVKLSRFDAQPWGFRLQGGTDFAQPLLVQKVNAGSLSEQAGLQPGDAVVKINDVDVFNLRHKDAQDIVVRSGNNFVITVQRGGSTWRPHVTPTGNVPQPNSPYLQTVTKTSLAHKQQDSQHIGCGYNNAARPFSNGGDGGVKSIVNKQYNTPVGIYSDESIAETLSAQAEVLAGGVLGVNFKKNEKEYQGDRSEVLKFLREEETGQSTPEPHSPANFYWTQSHAIGGNERRTPLNHQQPQQDERIGVPLQPNSLAPEASHRPSLPVAPKDNEEQARQDQQEQPDPRIIVLPICPGLQGPEYKAEMEAAEAALATDQDGRPRPLAASGHPACQLCGVGIVGVFVRIKDKNLHVECFKCATCGTSLKNQGYYNFNNKLYCDIHAKQAAINNPPTGTEGYVPVPIKPNTKLSASTISSALNSHGYGGNSNGYSNGNSTPAPAPPESESSQELPLPPPPSPTQLLQYEAEQQQHQQVLPEPHMSTIQPPQQQQKLEHTRTHSSLSSISSGSSSSGVGGSGSGSGSGSGVGQSQQSYSSTLSLDRFGSPLHSRQTSGSSTSLEVALAASGAGQGDNYIMTPPSPPPPPPPQAQSVTNYRLQAAQNENDMNTQNKSPNAYNQLLKEYSNKLQQQHHHNTTQHTTATTAPSLKHNNTAKPFAVAATSTPQQHLPHQQHQQQPLVAALTATLANQLKFNPHQVASSQATATVATVAPSAATAATAAATPQAATATDSPAATASSSDNMSAYVADEPSSIYGQISADSVAFAPPPPQPPTAGGGDQPFEYVTLTGNVIRSVHPPGKGACPSYKVNQGYARPFGAAAPKSPVSYPPQQQQQSPRPAPGGQNPYATLPRSNVGQQGRNVRYQQQQQQQYNNQQKQQYRNSYPMGSNYSTPSQSPYITSNTNNYSSSNSYNNNNYSTYNNNNVYRGAGGKSAGAFGATSAPKRGRGILNKAAGPGVRIPLCNSCNVQIRGPFITALGRIWCPDHFICVNGNCRRPLQDIGFVEEKGDLYCEYCFEKYLAPTCSKCAGKIKGDCLNAIGKHFHPECFTCGQCGKVFGNRPFFLEDGNAYCEADWNELFTTKCFACGFPVEAGDRWVEALNHNYHSQCFNCTFCKQNLEGQSFYNKGGRPFCKNHAR